MKKTNKRITPELITELSRCEIFVFGSNLEGQHHGGAARTAYEKFGAEWGVGDGPTGRCYAIPTMFKDIEDIRPYAEKFIDYAKAHPQNRFLLTRVGCGIAGFNDIDMAQLFQDCMEVPNITHPKEWLAGMLIDVTLGLKIPQGRDEAPKVITDDTLEQLCRKYQYQIGAGINNLVPRVKVRYVLDRNKFGYAYLGDFFFHNGKFFVWDTDDKWAGEHDQKAVLDTFSDECLGRGYAHKAIFAGVQTARVGTVFFQLDNNAPQETVARRASSFNMSRTEEGIVLMARYTPNFDQEEWKYKALELIGAEFNWNK